MTWGAFFVTWFALSVLFGLVAGRFLYFTNKPRDTVHPDRCIEYWVLPLRRRKR